MLSEQVEQYTMEMEKNALLVEELKKPLKKEKGHVSVQQRRLEDLSSKLLVAERRALRPSAPPNWLNVTPGTKTKNSMTP